MYFPVALSNPATQANIHSLAPPHYLPVTCRQTPTDWRDINCNTIPHLSHYYLAIIKRSYHWAYHRASRWIQNWIQSYDWKVCTQKRTLGGSVGPCSNKPKQNIPRNQCFHCKQLLTHKITLRAMCVSSVRFQPSLWPMKQQRVTSWSASPGTHRGTNWSTRDSSVLPMDKSVGAIFVLFNIQFRWV